MIRRREQEAFVYTSDKTVMRRLDKLSKDYPDIYLESDELSKTYSMPKSYVTYRKPRAVSNEQREQARQRMAKSNAADN